MLRTGIAGVGGLGTVHLKTLLKLNRQVRVTALADPIAERRSGERLTSQGLNLELDNDTAVSVGDIRSYEDYSGLCADPDLDMVCIATPSDLHAPAAIIALEHGKHVFTEKPMALGDADCQRMIDAAKANGRTLMVGQVLRFWPEYMAAKRIMDSGDYGKPIAATMHRYGATPRASWFADVRRSGGVNLDLHIHDVDAALWWWGEPQNVEAKRVGDTATASVVLSRWEYAAGPTVQIEASWDAGIPFAAEFRIMLERATLRFDSRQGGLTIYTRGEKKQAELSVGQAHAAEMIYFVDCLERGEAVTRCLPGQSALSVKYALHVQC